MTPSENIKDQILATLRRQESNPALAAEYSRFCRDLNRRLEQIEEVLDLGEEIQALQMAEIYPPVMEEADTLSFFQSRQWARLCEKNQVTVAPEIRSSGIARLTEIYGKGITSTHPIYKELREAILARDDEKALQVARTIESLAPGDSGAKAERERLERKIFAGLVAELGKALSLGDPVPVINLLERAEQMSLEEESEASAEIRAARRIRAERDARRAHVDVLEMISNLGSLRARDDWKGVAEASARIRDLVMRHSLTIDASQQSQIENAEAYAESMRAKAVKEAEFREVLRSFLICLDDATSRTQARGTLTIAETSELIMRLNKEWQAVESYGLPVDTSRVEETARMVETLRNELTRLQKRRVATISSVAAVVLAVIAVSGWLVSVQYRAGEMCRGLSSGRQVRSVSSVNQLVHDAEKSSLPWLSSSLSAELASSKKWLEGLEKENASCTEALASLIKRSGDFASEDPARLDTECQKIRSRVGELPEEQRRILQPDLNKLDKVYSDHLAVLGAKDDKLLEGWLESFEEIAKTLAAGGLSLAEVEKALGRQKEQVAAWASVVHSLIKELPINADLKARAEADEDKTRSLDASIENAQSAIKAMGAATSIEAFRAALDSLRKVDLPCSSLSQKSRIAGNSECTPDSLLPELLFPGNAGAYASLKKGVSDDNESRRLFPKSALPIEVTPFLAILNDELTPDAKVYNLEGGQPPRSVYSQLEIKPSIEDWDRPSFTVKTYDPEHDSKSTPGFTMKTYRADATGWEKARKITGGFEAMPSQIYRDLGLKGVISDSLQVQVSILQLLDRLTRIQETKPDKEAKEALEQTRIYQAYVIEKLLEMSSKRPFAWGLQYSPGAWNLMKGVDQAVRVSFGNLPPGAWMAPDYRRILPELTPLLEKPRHFNEEAQLNKLLAEQVIDVDALTYAGHVDEEGKPHLVGDLTAPPSDLYGLGGEGEARKPARVFRVRKGTQPAEYDAMAKPVPLTPLYSLKKGRASMVDSGMKALRIEQLGNELTLSPLFDDTTSPAASQSISHE